MFKSRLRRGFISMLIIIMSSFLAVSILAISKFNSQIMFTSERNIIETQTYYNAYSGIQRGIYEIRKNKEYTGWDYFSLDGSSLNSTGESVTQNLLYSKYEVTSTNLYGTYYYLITGTGYGKFKGTLLETSLEAHVIVDYNVENPTFKISKIVVK